MRYMWNTRVNCSAPESFASKEDAVEDFLDNYSEDFLRELEIYEVGQVFVVQQPRRQFTFKVKKG